VAVAPVAVARGAVKPAAEGRAVAERAAGKVAAADLEGPWVAPVAVQAVLVVEEVAKEVAERERKPRLQRRQIGRTRRARLRFLGLFRAYRGRTHRALSKALCPDPHRRHLE
jgi:hypothetical protein